MALIKKIISLSIVLVISFSFFCVNAATDPDVLRVYKKVITDSDFIELFNVASESFDDYNVTEDYIHSKMKEFIGGVINTAVTDKTYGRIDESNLKSQMKTIIIQHVLGLDATLFAIILDNLTEEEMNQAFSGEFPKRFNGLYNVLYIELQYILGYKDRGVDVIFDDMQGYEWSSEAVDSLFNARIVNGMSDFLYCPGENVTREQFVKLLCEAFEITKGELETEFLDADKNAWYYPYLLNMASNGLVNGLGDGNFGIGRNITRQDMAVMMYRVGEKLGYFSSMPAQKPFEDSNEIASYAITAVNSLRANGIINGDDKNRFNPQKFATRAEAAQIIYNMYKYN